MSEYPNPIIFGRCKLFPNTRILLGDDHPVKLGARALDLLVCLANARGDVVSQNDLMKAAWPNATVGENTLRVQIKNLRAALTPFGAADSIVNRNGRGYEFASLDGLRVDPVERAANAGVVSTLIGRTALVDATLKRLASGRCISLVGPGGIGKTAVAKAIRDIAGPAYGDGSYFIDLSTTEDDTKVSSSLASLLGLSVLEEDPTGSIIQFLRGKKTLLVLDTCEKVVSAVAALVENVISATSGVDILITSREALRIPYEQIVEVPPLEFAFPTEGASVEQLLSYAAPRLFLERATAAGYTQRTGDDLLIFQLCARLDGLPLAIELAAGRVREFGVGNLLHQLDNRFAILGDGFRTAAPRQRALHAALDWSYDLLSLEERRLFARISIFRGEFQLSSVCEVAQSADLPQDTIPLLLGQLVKKSLVMPTTNLDHGFRLLNTTRAYAQDHLSRSQDFDTTAGKHAEYCLAWIASKERFREGSLAIESNFEDVRAALDWAASKPDTRRIYLALVIAAVPYMVEHSLINECMRNAISALSFLAPDSSTSYSAMQLQAALGGALMNIDGAGERTMQAWRQVFRISGRLKNYHYRLISLWGLWVEARNRGDYNTAFLLAKRYARLARRSDDPTVKRNLNRMLGISHFFAGEFDLARQFLERSLQLTKARGRESIRHFQFDSVVTARCFLAQILWLQGHPEQGNLLAVSNVNDALELNHSGTLLYALTEGACPVSFNTGDLDRTEAYCELVLSRAAGKGHEVWRTLGECYLGIVKMRRGDSKGFGATEEALRALRLRRFGPFTTRALGEFAIALAREGRLEEARSAISEAMERATANGEGWCFPELLRIRAEVAMARNHFDPTVEPDLVQSLTMAKEQNALGWQLRTATTLAKFYQTKNELKKARWMLVGVLENFHEGFVTGDIQAAVSLAEQIEFQINLEHIAGAI